MTTLTFDKLKFFKTLNANGFTEQQADGLTGAFQESLVESQSELATKTDLIILKHDMEKFMVKALITAFGLLGTLNVILHFIK
jgi:hypothetical protein